MAVFTRELAESWRKYGDYGIAVGYHGTSTRSADGGLSMGHFPWNRNDQLNFLSSGANGIKWDFHRSVCLRVCRRVYEGMSGRGGRGGWAMLGLCVGWGEGPKVLESYISSPSPT